MRDWEFCRRDRSMMLDTFTWPPCSWPDENGCACGKESDVEVGCTAWRGEWLCHAHNRARVERDAVLDEMTST